MTVDVSDVVEFDDVVEVDESAEIGISASTTSSPSSTRSRSRQNAADIVVDLSSSMNNWKTKCKFKVIEFLFDIFFSFNVVRTFAADVAQ